MKLCRDCRRAAAPNSAYCPDCIDRIARDAFMPEWRRRALEGKGVAKDMTRAA